MRVRKSGLETGNALDLQTCRLQKMASSKNRCPIVKTFTALVLTLTLAVSPSISQKVTRIEILNSDSMEKDEEQVNAIK